MNIFQKLIHGFVATLSLALSFGILTHDTHIDKAYATALASGRSPHGYTEAGQLSALQPIEEMRGNQHTHTSYNPLRSTLANSFTYQSPSIGPRRDSHHKQLLRTLEVAGRHAFDNANLPIIS
jgi:hypothetical protein